MNKIILFSILAVILLSVSFTSVSALTTENEQKLNDKIKSLEKKLIDKIKTLEKKIKDLLAENTKLKTENTKLKTENTKLKTKQIDSTKPNTALGPEDCISQGKLWQNNACVDATKPKPIPTPESKELGIASFVDPTLDPQFYVNRYNNEPKFKEWFDKTYPEYSSIYQAVGLKKPLHTSDPENCTANQVWQNQVCVDATKPNTALGPENCTANQVWQNQVCVDATKPPKNDLNLQTDLDLYRQGDTVVITGLIHNIENLSTGDVAIIVRAPDNGIVTQSQVHPNSDGSFQTSFKADGPQFIAVGDYTVLANFAGLKSQITFKFTGGNGAIVSGGDSQPTSCPSGQNLINGKCVVSMPISVMTDKTYYKYGDIIKISGKVREMLYGIPVSLQVITAGGDNFTTNLKVNADNTFSINLTAKGTLWESSGTYAVKVLYGTQARNAQITFEFMGTS